jgi:HK97 gp10 family phage protein
MPDGITLHLDSRQLERNLQAIPAQLEAKIARQALQAGGNIVQAAAIAAAPFRTGALKDDIVTKVHTNTSGNFADNYILIGPGYDRSRLQVRNRGVHAGAPDSSSSPGVYGKFVELGHAGPGMAREKRRGEKASLAWASGKDTPPHPWLKPAFEATKDAALEAMRAVMEAGLEAVAAALQK